MAKSYFPFPAPSSYSEGAWPIWLEGSIYHPVSKCLPHAADTRPRFLRHWPPSSLCGDPLSALLFFQTLCPRLSTLHKRPGHSRGLGGEKGFGTLVGGREWRRSEEADCCPLRLVVPPQTLYFLIVFCMQPSGKGGMRLRLAFVPQGGGDLTPLCLRSLWWRREKCLLGQEGEEKGFSFLSASSLQLERPYCILASGMFWKLGVLYQPSLAKHNGSCLSSFLSFLQCGPGASPGVSFIAASPQCSQQP